MIHLFLFSSLHKHHTKAADVELIQQARTNLGILCLGRLVKWCLITFCLVCGKALRSRVNSRKMASSRSRMKPFVTKFHGKTQLTSTEFMEVFRKYDKDGKLRLSSVEIYLCCVILGRATAAMKI